jgi:TolB-like protein/Flp pilus assembly protein TadD
VAEGGEEQTIGIRTATPDVFISYASRDAAVANDVAVTLEGQGLKCWIAPRDVTPGAHYASEIVHAIDSAKAIVLILSQDAGTSPHVLREIERATSKRHPVITLRVDLAPLPAEFEYFLNTSQWLDASGGDARRMTPKLVAAVKSVIKAPAATPPTALISNPPARSALSRRPNRAAIVVVSLIALALAGVAVNWLRPSSRRATPTSAPVSAPAAPTIPEKSVAVLPFVDMSEKKNHEYFSDGLSEELIDRLAHTPDLKVIARTSSFQFKGKSEDMRTIGQKLGVANLLEGSVRTSGKTLRVTAQLIKVSDGSHLWSETYDRDVGDIFKVQDDIAAAVVSSLRATLTKFTPSTDDKPPNIDAYNAILRGRYFRRMNTKEDSERAVALFKEAIRLDPNNAVAWVDLGEAYNDRLGTAWMVPASAYTEARKAVDHALAINPNLADAHYLLGSLEWNYDYDFAVSLAELHRARELDPGEPRLNTLGFFALINGKNEEALQIFRHHVEIDPLNTDALSILAGVYFATNRLSDSERAWRDLLTLHPNYAGAYCSLGDVLLAESKPDEALAVMSKETDDASRVNCLPHALWILNRREEADSLMTEASNRYADSGAYYLAQSYAMRNDKALAFKWLERAHDNREAPVSVMTPWDPLLRSLHGDPRFKAFLRKMNLPEPPETAALL